MASYKLYKNGEAMKNISKTHGTGTDEHLAYMNSKIKQMKRYEPAAEFEWRKE